MAIPTPIAYWKFDESSGNASDSVGGFTLTNNNTVSFGSGKINNTADFGTGNTNKTFTTTNKLGLTVNASRSFAGWVNINTAPGAMDIMGMGYETEDVFYVFEYIDFGGGTLRLRVGRGRNGVDDPNLLYTTTLSTGTWYHLGYTFNGSTFAQELYLNGSSVTTSTAVSGNGSGSTFDGTVFGRALFGLSRLANAKTDEWGVWNVVLTAGEISELYNSGSGKSYPFSVPSTGFFAVM